jgi:hypothetical protein
MLLEHIQGALVSAKVSSACSALATRVKGGVETRRFTCKPARGCKMQLNAFLFAGKKKHTDRRPYTAVAAPPTCASSSTGLLSVPTSAEHKVLSLHSCTPPALAGSQTQNIRTNTNTNTNTTTLVQYRKHNSQHIIFINHRTTPGCVMIACCSVLQMLHGASAVTALVSTWHAHLYIAIHNCTTK